MRTTLYELQHSFTIQVVYSEGKLASEHPAMTGPENCLAIFRAESKFKRFEATAKNYRNGFHSVNTPWPISR